MNNYELANLHSAKDDWTTPQALFKALDAEFHFTLDPCSTDENALCKKHFTKAEDGLSQKWGGEIVFMNPPYCRETGKWIRKAYEESLEGATVMCLIPARPDASYWHDYIFPYASRIWFIKDRLHFSDHKERAGFPSALILFQRFSQGNYEKLSYRLEGK